MNLNPQAWAGIALFVGVACLAAPAAAQDRPMVVQQPEKAVQRAESPFGPAIKVSPATQPHRVESPRAAPVAETPIASTVPRKLESVEPLSPPMGPRANTWTLEAGIPLHIQLRAWAEKAGWELEWKVPRSWVVPARTEFVGTFDEALEKVVVSLTNEGKPLQLNIWEGNHVAQILEVTPR